MAAEHNHVVAKERSRFCDYLRKGVLAFYLWEFTDAHETEYEPTIQGSYNFRFHSNACHDCSPRTRIDNFSLHRHSGFACTMAAEHNHVVAKERSRFCDYLRKGVLAYLLPEIGYEDQILLNRDPSQTSALAMHCVFHIAHN